MSRVALAGLAIATAALVLAGGPGPGEAAGIGCAVKGTTIAGIALPMPRSRDVAAARALGLVPAAPRPAITLTHRERAIAEHTARGASNQEVADALSISVRTVETHLTKIYAKLGVGSRGAMTALMHELDI